MELITHHDGDERISEFLVVHLRVDVDAREPTAVPRMRVVPSDRILQPSHLQVHGASIGLWPITVEHTK